MRILLVEDDENLAHTLTSVLSKNNYILDISADGEMAWEMINIVSYDLILLDVMLPKLDGLSLCRRLRKHDLQIPVMMMTARDSMGDKLIGLDSGADDYLIKPFEIQELLTRIRVLSRRLLAEQSTAVFSCGNVRLNPQMREITCNGQALSLSRKEYLLMELFLRYPSRVFSRSDIIDRLWSLDKLPTEDTVKSHIRRIRRKLKQVGAEDMIETLYGHGYRVNPRFLKNSGPNASELAAQRKELNDAIVQIWDNVRGGIFQQVETLEGAAIALQSGYLDLNGLQAAQKSAHQLAGTVATFGFEAASHIARAIEILLQTPPDAIDPNSLSPLVKTVRLQLEEPAGNFLVNGENAPDPLEPAVSALDFPADLGQVRVLVIDDDPAIPVLVCQILANLGIEAIALEKPTQIWKALETVQPNFLIVDVNMPEIGGLELCRMIRETPQWSWLPILAITVETDRQTVQRVFASGADDYLSKPIVPEELSTQVLNRIRRSQQLRRQS